MVNQKIKNRRTLVAVLTAAIAAAIISLGAYFLLFRENVKKLPVFDNTRLLFHDQRSEPFGLAILNGEIFFSDGIRDAVYRISPAGEPTLFAGGFDTPSAIAFTADGRLIVADTGSHTIKAIDRSGGVSVVAGTPGQRGDRDGSAGTALFNGPIGVAVQPDGTIIVADTYNDKIKAIREGSVVTISGNERGFADGAAAKFDTPTGVAPWSDGRVLVADSENCRVRVIEQDGKVWTLAGTGERSLADGLLNQAAFIRPTAITVSENNEIAVSDGDAVRIISPRMVPIVETLSAKRRGFEQGRPHRSRFNRLSGLVFGAEYLATADSDNASIRQFEVSNGKSERSKPAAEVIEPPTRVDPAEFRLRQPGRWPYDPPLTKRDIAGTLGEIRGKLENSDSQVWFHNGLDIAGAYGETARFVRTEKVLRPNAAENFGTLRELIRMPELGYIHIRLGRDQGNRPFGDDRFQFSSAMDSVRVPRGAKFNAGEPIGTLNAMNHVHLIAGPSGDEMNALNALELPGVVDTIAPVIEKITLMSQSGMPIETVSDSGRIKVGGAVSVVAKAYDRVDGNPERRRLGVFKLGYQLLKPGGEAISEPVWTINFDRNPDADSVRLAYATGSHSGATGETIFNYMVTNTVNGGYFKEGFINLGEMSSGEYTLRVFAADFFGNTAKKDISIEVVQ